jgi:uncharacterized protein
MMAAGGPRLTLSRPCNTNLSNGSCNHRPPDAGARRVARASCRQGRRAPGTARARTASARNDGAPGSALHAACWGRRRAAGPLRAQGIFVARRKSANRQAASMKGIADTGFLVAFANRKDQHHAWAVALAERIDAPALTCEAVLAESAFHLRDSSVVLRMLGSGLVKLSFDCGAQLQHLSDLAERYADRQPDLADLCLIRMSELYPLHSVLTVDRADFAVYRRNRRDAIPVVCPPKRRRPR